MFVYPRLPMVLKHPFKEQPGSSMPNNAKNTELHPQKGCSNPSLKGIKQYKLPRYHETAVAKAWFFSLKSR